MSYEHRLRTLDPAWATLHRGFLDARIRALGTFAGVGDDGALWLKDPASGSPWPFDVRLFLDDAGVFVEVSASTAALRADLRALTDAVAAETPVRLEDDDGPLSTGH